MQGEVEEDVSGGEAAGAAAAGGPGGRAAAPAGALSSWQQQQQLGAVAPTSAADQGASVDAGAASTEPGHWGDSNKQTHQQHSSGAANCVEASPQLECHQQAQLTASEGGGEYSSEPAGDAGVLGSSSSGSVPGGVAAVPPSPDGRPEQDLSSALLMVKGRLEGQPATILLDGGSCIDAASSRWCKQVGVRPAGAALGDAPQAVHTADGKQLAVEGLLPAARLRVGEYSSSVRMPVLPLAPSMDAILGKPWLTRVNPQIDWRHNLVTFEWRGTVHQWKCTPVKYTPAGIVPALQEAQADAPTVQIVGAKAMRKLLRQGAQGYLALLSHVLDPEQLQSDAAAGGMGQEGAAAGGGGSTQATPQQLQHGGDQQQYVAAVEPAQQQQQPQQQQQQGAGDTAAGTAAAADHQQPTVEELIEQMVQSSPFPQQQQQLRETLLEHKQAFDKQLAAAAPDYQPPVECTIPLQPGAKPYRISSPRPLSPRLLEELRKQLQQLLDAGFIRPSSSEYAAPIVFCEKADGSLRLAIDYRQLNSSTLRTAYPIPRISEILEQLRGAQCFSTLDLVQAFHHVPVAAADVEKTAFSTRYGLFEWLVMPFGLSGAPGQFMRTMNAVLKPLLDKCCIVFMDDILVYSPTPEQHVEDVAAVLRLLTRAGLVCKPSKCKVLQQQVKFLGFIISGQGVAVDPAKTAAIREWPVPTEQRHVRQFLGMANFYRRFIRRFSHIAKPLNDLLRTGSGGHTRSSSRAASRAAVRWGAEQQQAFDALKEALCSPPVLTTFDPEQPCVVTTDASEYAVGGVLEQITADGRKPVAYASRSLNPAEQNYTVTERENLALVYCLQEWQHMLEGHPHPVQCLTDHEALLSLLTKPALSRREARWIGELAGFNLKLAHIQGSTNAVGDPLSRRPDHEQLVAPAAVGAPPGWQLAQRFGLLDTAPPGLASAAADVVTAVLAPVQPAPTAAAALSAAAVEGAGGQVQPGEAGAVAALEEAAAVPGPPTAAHSSTVGPEGSQQQQKAPPLVGAAVAVAVAPNLAFAEAVKAAYPADSKTAAVLQQLQRGERIPPRNGQRWVLQDGLLYQVKGKQRRLYVPADRALQQQILQQYHDAPAAGHKGSLKTLERVRKHYNWAGLATSVQEYCRTCPVCQSTKARNTQPAGLARPLPVPDKPWQSISADLITQLPSSHGHTAIVVFVDRFSKQAHFVASTTEVTAAGLADLFLDTVCKHHGVPSSLVTDRDTRFKSGFWEALCSKLGVDSLMSTANHPQTDGQTERVNMILEEYLRAYVSARQDNWSQLLPMAEFAYNSAVQESTGYAPFELVYGYTPDSPADAQARALQQQPPQQQQQQQGQPAGPDQQQQQQLSAAERRREQRRRGASSAADRLLQQLQSTWQLAKERIQAAQQRQAAAANKRRREVVYKAGDLVRLNVGHLRKLNLPGSLKLHKKWLGPYEIIRMAGPNAAELKLPPSFKCHPVINVDQLEHWRQSEAFDQRVEPPPDPVLIDGEEEYEVEQILDMRKRRYGKGVREEYLVHWKGYPEYEATWEPRSYLTNVRDLLREFHQRKQRTASLLACLQLMQ